MNGDAAGAGRTLSFADIAYEADRYIQRTHGLKAVRPQCHTPLQDAGDLARVPLFADARLHMQPRSSDPVRGVLADAIGFASNLRFGSSAEPARTAPPESAESVIRTAAEPKHTPVHPPSAGTGPAPPSGLPRPGDRIQDAPFAPQLVVVSADKFLMGSPEGEGWGNERPRHWVTIAQPFAVGRFPVTFDEWDAALRQGGVHYRPGDEGWGRGRRPAINVSWRDARAYVTWLSEVTGNSYRLLSEAEWEYCCRAETTTKYSFGETISGDQARFGDDAVKLVLLAALALCSYGLLSHWLRKRRKTVEVGTFPANIWGLHDMHGNIWEWCEDNWHSDYSGNPPVDGSAWKAKGKWSDSSSLVMRGGSWNTIIPGNLRSAYRGSGRPDDRGSDIGFRVAGTL